MLRIVTVVRTSQRKLVQIAVDLVRRGKQQRNRRRTISQLLEQCHCSYGIYLEISPGRADAGRHCRLSSKVKRGTRGTNAAPNGPGIPDVGELKFQQRAEF